MCTVTFSVPGIKSPHLYSFIVITPFQSAASSAFYLTSRYTISVTLSLYIEAYQLTIGPCPLQIDEPCDTGIIKFYLHHNASYVQLLDPFKPKLPGFFNKSVPTKIIIHGYSGSLDYATTTLTRGNF